jgi:hypothetical protein
MSKDDEKYVTPRQYRIAHKVWEDADGHHKRAMSARKNAQVEEANAKIALADADSRMLDASLGLQRWIVDGHGGDE